MGAGHRGARFRAGHNATPEIRKFVLQQANYLRSQLRLYVRLTDASGARTFRVFPIGPMVSFGRPEPQVDKFSNMHLLYQDGPHSSVTPSSIPTAKSSPAGLTIYVDKRPRLMPDAEGKVLVTGGVRRPTAKDIPPSKPEKPAEAAPKPKPSPGEMMLPEP